MNWWNSAFVVFSIVNEWGDILINRPNRLFGTRVNNTLGACWKKFLTKLQCTKATSTDSNFGTSSPSLSWSTSFLIRLSNFTVSRDNNCSL